MGVDSILGKDRLKYANFTDGDIKKLSKNEIENILDELSDLFVKKGLNDNDSPNEFGLFIEKLIDKFSRVYYE